MVELHHASGASDSVDVDTGRDAKDVSVLVNARLLTEDDIPWLFDMSTRRYPRYDRIATELWFRNLVLKTPLLYLPQRTENAFSVSMLAYTPWFPNDWECHVVFICAETHAEWEAMRLMRASVAWARSRKCTIWRVSSDTDSDLTMFARRLGAKEVSPRFTINLKE